MAQAVKSTITKASRNELLHNIKDSYKKCNASGSNSDQYDRSYQPQQTSPHIQWTYAETSRHAKNLTTCMTNCTSHTNAEPTVTQATNTTRCSTVSVYFTQKPNTETETPKHKTLINTVVPKNEVLSITLKLSINYAPSHT